MTSDDPFDFDRFTQAQNRGGTYERAVSELRAGRKTSHWMWFVFPQIAGLGRSAMALRYAIASLEEAEAYTRHPVLGLRLTACSRIVAELTGRTADEILGETDAMKLCSSMTLFARTAPDNHVFATVLDRHFDGAPDSGTESKL